MATATKGTVLVSGASIAGPAVAYGCTATGSR